VEGRPAAGAGMRRERRDEEEGEEEEEEEEEEELRDKARLEVSWLLVQ